MSDIKQHGLIQRPAQPIFSNQKKSERGFAFMKRAKRERSAQCVSQPWRRQRARSGDGGRAFTARGVILGFCVIWCVSVDHFRGLGMLKFLIN